MLNAYAQSGIISSERPMNVRCLYHPAWEMVEMVMSRQQPLTSELPPVTEDIVIEPVAEWLAKEVSSEQ